ncbi:hypothetical protein BSKO_03651 [Bryopsis sp. KO-2023]|nr:hypothetical protein BSKO_03651 [Bryopsis sp. KO-2023]
MSIDASQVQKALEERLEASDVEVVDTSGGCGAAFEVYVVSQKFEGKKVLERHRMVKSALEEEMKVIHALSIKRTWTPQQKLEKEGN